MFPKQHSILRNIPIFTLLITAFLVGTLTVRDYGISWDEAGIFRYSGHLPEAYKNVLDPQRYEPDNYNWILNYYGPAHFIYSELMSRALINFQPSWGNGTAQHFSYLITFLGGMLCLYLLLNRWFGEWTAFGAVLLFVTQPLFWGHALMNPKDLPFMAFFIASIYLGFRMIDDASLKNVLLAGIVLGISTSIRPIAPMAGVIVILYGLWKLKLKILPTALWYAIAALMSAYLAWPYLWKGPIENFWGSLEIMSQFPFDAKILFRGTLYPPDCLPRSYVPTLFFLQLTEPLLALSLVGFVMMLFSRKNEALFLFGSWFLLPIAGIILSRSVLYDNARQIFFLLPPIFILAGFALEFLNTRVPNKWIKNTLLLFFVLPGIIAGIRLHPYEYVYYNSLIGGVRGADAGFETDYWGVSFKEAMDYVNENAPLNARVMVLSGPDETAAYYARPDIQIITEETDYLPDKGYDYALILTRKNINENRCPNSETVHTIGRDGVVFTYIRQLGSERHCK